jgi:hypothetical protein
MGFVRTLCDYHYLPPNAGAIPIRVKNGKRLERRQESCLFAAVGEKLDEEAALANLSQPARSYLAKIGAANPDADAETSGLIWMHALAIGYSPQYLRENADGIRQDWPRIPLPDSRETLAASAELGKRIAALLDTENDVPGITSGAIQPQLSTIAVISAVAGESLDPDAGDLAVTAGWGHAGKDGVTMPAKGKLRERAYSQVELDSGLCKGCLGDCTLDVHLNEHAYWRNIPRGVWDYHIGGYQVIKKWLSYREHKLLGRALTADEAREVTNMVRRIAAILLLEPELDQNYGRVKDATYPWLQS